METVFYNNKIYRVQQKKIVQIIFMNYISIIYINITAKWIDPLAVLCLRIDFTGTSPSDANT